MLAKYIKLYIVLKIMAVMWNNSGRAWGYASVAFYALSFK